MRLQTMFCHWKCGGECAQFRPGREFHTLTLPPESARALETLESPDSQFLLLVGFVAALCV